MLIVGFSIKKAHRIPRINPVNTSPGVWSPKIIRAEPTIPPTKIAKQSHDMV